MPSTFTSRLGFEEQATGENSGTWGTNLNSNVIELVDAAIAGLTSVDLASGDVTLTKANGTPDQARSAIIYLHGVLTADRSVVVPSVTKAYIVDNKTTGSYTATVKTAGGSGVQVPQSAAAVVYSTGSSVVQAAAATSSDLSGYATKSGANIFTSVNAFDKQVWSSVVPLTWAAVLSVPFDRGNSFICTLAGATSVVPSGHKPGQGGVIYLCQDATGSRTAAWDSQFKWSDGSAPTLTTSVSCVDAIPYHVRSSVAIDAAVRLNQR